MGESVEYDLVILGGGAAAFAAITEASDRGLSTAMVNTGLPIGGTCVNVGCVPSKHLLAVGESAFAASENPFDAVQYREDEPTVDWPTALDGTGALVERFRQSNYVDVADHFGTDIYEGYGELVSTTTIAVVDGPDDGTRLAGEKTLIATGSSPRAPPIPGLEGTDYYTSETILQERHLPGSIVVIGGGYVGLEWGQILHRVGVDVTILQRSERVLSAMEGQLGRELERALAAEGINVVTGTDIRRVRSGSIEADPGDRGDGVVVETEVDGERQDFSAAGLFVATGVQANSTDVGLEAVGVETRADGSIDVDEYLRTTAQDVYAAGDVVGDPMLETVAAKEGNYAVRNAFGDDGVTIDYGAVPAVVFTSPEVASVGITELEYMNEHGTCSCRTVEMNDVPRAQTVQNTEGLVQVVKHHETDEIVGVHVVAPRAADMIMEATLAVKFGLTVDDIVDTVHPFPTFSEAFKHACQAFRRDVSTMSCCVE